jgi:hypothetical protein
MSGLGRADAPDRRAAIHAQTVEFCDLQKNTEKLNGKMVRVRALWKTDFEQSTLTAPSCVFPLPTIWVDFEKSWESRTSWRHRHATNHVKWGMHDVVFVGIMRTGGRFGHQDMYSDVIQVHRVEAVRPLGSFRPFP